MTLLECEGGPPDKTVAIVSAAAVHRKVHNSALLFNRPGQLEVVCRTKVLVLVVHLP